jgi:hypothetical protein
MAPVGWRYTTVTRRPRPGEVILVLLAERILTLYDDQELVSLIFSYSYELNKLFSDDYIVLFPRYWI